MVQLGDSQCRGKFYNKQYIVSSDETPFRTTRFQEIRHPSGWPTLAVMDSYDFEKAPL